MGASRLTEYTMAFQFAQKGFQKQIESGVQLEEPFHTGIHMTVDEFCRWILEEFHDCNIFLGFSPSPTSVQAFTMWRDPADPNAAAVVQSEIVTVGDKLSIPLAVIFQGRENIPSNCR
ncbi:hypothetical protein KFL_001450120 [Klebsormidium nitens]|uniref:Uncharacterized protein n=1 Tax=Klebsormidium nitens TaxID=105231 RepID=A0A1Y1HXH3_KLENI|nr:hypothetical protein KFL_001450120 [Klebsormidium nitens]|eukprot:GAQ83360.1 hypothetical protein KFL_001450120 [Klebsormidium nitens]